MGKSFATHAFQAASKAASPGAACAKCLLGIVGDLVQFAFERTNPIVDFGFAAELL
ncbi:MAG: hypothetical protein JOY94_10545 [Methylobacteriaceae bacterium]|nr:hypothetical protein [Methylobacteriaceae bacterium]